jgi:cytochrome c-type biogenesis protein CcmF
MTPGQTVELGGYAFTFKGTKEIPGPNYTSMQGDFEVKRLSGGTPFPLKPEKRLYQASGQTMTEAAINSGFLGDVYVSLGEPVDGGAWGVRVYLKPFVDWIWGGCFLMAIGGVLAISDRRYRVGKAAAAADALAAEGARA